MAEKAAGKKDQQKNKKSKQNEKKKNNENGVKHMNEQQHVHETNHVNHKKKDKGNKHNSNHPVKRNNSGPKGKKSDSLLKRYFQLLFITTGYLFLAAGFLYLVDYDKYVKVREGGIAVLNKTLSLLPDEVVNKGKGVLIPIAEAIVRRLNLIINETSSFLNTNPVVKDHWTNIREIGSVCGGCLVEYLRTLYNHVTQYWCDAKAKLF